MRNLFALLALSFFSITTLAAPAMNSGFKGSLGLSLGAGTAGNKDKSIKSVDLAYSEAILDTGYYFGSIGPVMQASYRYVGQRTNPDNAGGNNMGGTGYKVGAGLGFAFPMFSLSAYYDLFSQFDLSKKSSGGSKVSYTDASGFSVALKYNWRPTWAWVLNFSQLKYSERKSGATKVDLSTNPVTYTLYGVGLAYRF